MHRLSLNLIGMQEDVGLSELKHIILLFVGWWEIMDTSKH